MSETTTMSTFCWQECMTPDAAASRKFYCDLLGWTTSEMPMGDCGTYTMFHPAEGEDPVGGFMEMNGPEWENIPPHWLSYISVTDVDEKAKQVLALGGKIMVEATEIPGVGKFCVISDPTGAVIALFEGCCEDECGSEG